MLLCRRWRCFERVPRAGVAAGCLGPSARGVPGRGTGGRTHAPLNADLQEPAHHKYSFIQMYRAGDAIARAAGGCRGNPLQAARVGLRVGLGWAGG